MENRTFESLQKYQDSYYESLLLNESFISEGLNMNKIQGLLTKVRDKKEMIGNLLKKFNSSTNFKMRKYIAILLMILVSMSSGPKLSSGATLDKNSTEMANTISPANLKIVEDFLERRKKEKAYNAIVSELAVKNNPSIIASLNQINKNRFSHKRLDFYDQYDSAIADGIMELMAKGEKPNVKMIKAIMMVETGMRPVKNRLGYEGFPQTRQNEIDWVNSEEGTSFTKKDLYNPKESAKFIHYLTKILRKSAHINNLNDVLAGYNWGMGNVGKLKRGEKKLPRETKDYINLVSVFLNA